MQDARERMHSITGQILTNYPLQSVRLIIERNSADSSTEFGKFGVDINRATPVESGRGLTQIPRFSITTITDGWRRDIVSAPVAFLARENANKFDHASVIYEHRYLFPSPVKPVEALTEPRNLVYVGVTKRSWTARWNEHLASAASGSHYDFHQAIRLYEGKLHSQHTILAIAQDWDVALKYEEELVADISLRPKGFNMIPGEKAGIAFATRYGVRVVKPKEWEQRDLIVRKIATGASRLGKPNPAMSIRLSNDPDLMLKLVESRQNTFSSNDIALIRSLDAMGKSWREIASELGVKDIYRVRDVVDGKTYKFVRD